MQSAFNKFSGYLSLQTKKNMFNDADPLNWKTLLNNRTTYKNRAANTPRSININKLRSLSELTYHQVCCIRIVKVDASFVIK